MSNARDKFDHKRMELFCQMIAQGKTVTEACRVLKVSRVIVYTRREKNQMFKDAWTEAEKVGTGLLEDEALKRCKRSDNLLMFMLKARKPEVYRDGPRGGSLKMPGGAGDEASASMEFTFDFGNDTQVRAGK